MSITNNVARAKTDYDEVYAAGKKAQYDEFWDNFQDYGNRTAYEYGFRGIGWNDISFYPKYDIIAVGLSQAIFYASTITDFVAVFEKTRTVLDVSNATNISELFCTSSTTRIPTISTVGADNFVKVFYDCHNLVTIEKKIFRSDNSQTYNSVFTRCYALENLIVEGTISQGTINLSWSKKLSKTSITSVINALSTTTSALSVTLSKTAVNNAFETSAGAADGSTSAEWNALIATRSNWTINLLDS